MLIKLRKIISVVLTNKKNNCIKQKGWWGGGGWKEERGSGAGWENNTELGDRISLCS